MVAKRFGIQLDLQKIPVVNIVPESSSTAPSSPVAGQLWVDTSVTPAKLKVYENGSWEPLSNVGVELQANKGQANGYASLDANAKVPIAQIPVGTTSGTVAAGDDARLTNSRTPTGSAGGDLTGTYPNPTIAALAVTDAKVASANKDGVAGTPSMRTLGTGAQQALPGNVRLDQIAVPTAAVSLNSQRLTNLATPTSDSDAATKLYVDLARQGIRLKEAVKVATTANITLSNTQTIDGVAVAAGDRVLVKNQTTAADNGIYVAAAGAWTRASDADTAAEVNDGATTFVQQGSTQADTSWSQINTIATIGTTAQNWVQQGAAASYIAGAGLTLTGNTFDIVAADGSIVVSADSITVGLVPVTKGGTGATTAAGARTALGAVGKFAQAVPAIAAGNEVTITHNLGTSDVTWSIRNSSGQEEEVGVRVIDTNTIGISADVAYTASALRVVVTG